MERRGRQGGVRWGAERVLRGAPGMAREEGAGGSALHPESLRRLHLLDHAFLDPHFDIIPRAFDRGWHYAKLIPTEVSGFNPFISAAIVGERSSFRAWAADATRSARPFNDGDHLAREALWVAHDYLHAWAYRAIHQLRPRLGLATRRITRGALDDLLFAHILTEAAAVVGLDYWYLSIRGVEARCPIGSGRAHLAVTYREQDRHDYLRFNPGFVVQAPSFFQWVCCGYLTGRYHGFAPADLERSPGLRHWLVHELKYGIKQRRYFRQWLHFLAGCPDWGDVDWDAPLELGARWRRALVSDLGALLWEKVKRRRAHFFPRIAPPSETWQSPAALAPDPRFVNVAHLPRERLPRKPDPQWFRRWFEQHVSGYELARVPADVVSRVPALAQAHDVDAVFEAFEGQPRLTPRAEPRDLLFLS